MDVTQKSTSKSDSSWTEGVFNAPTIDFNTTGQAIGLIIGKKG